MAETDEERVIRERAYFLWESEGRPKAAPWIIGDGRLPKCHLQTRRRFLTVGRMPTFPPC